LRQHYGQVFLALEKYATPRRGVFIHGAGVGRNGSIGFDGLASVAAEKLGFCVYGFPADWERFPKSGGPIRNRLCVGVLFAFKAAGYRLAFVAFPTGGPGTSGAIDLVTKQRDQRGVAVQIDEFPITLEGTNS